MSLLTTHVLNQAEGIPGVGVMIELFRMDDPPLRLATVVTDADGRSPTPLLPEATAQPGRYELRFHIGAYFAARGMGPMPPFLDVVAINVWLAPGQGHYHVPLGCTPWAYATYRGS